MSNHLSRSLCLPGKSQPAPPSIHKEPIWPYTILSNHFQTSLEACLPPESLIKLLGVFFFLSQYPLCLCVVSSVSTPNLIFWLDVNLTSLIGTVSRMSRWWSGPPGVFLLWWFCFSFLNCLCCPLASVLFELCSCLLANLNYDLLSGGNLVFAALCCTCWILLSLCYRFNWVKLFLITDAYGQGYGFGLSS